MGMPLPVAAPVEGFAFCTRCGTRYEIGKAAFCASCGTRYEIGKAAFCASCGNKLGE